jgi:PIN domain
MAMKRGPDKGQELSETRILIDTSVWLDVAKDYRQQTLLSALEELTRRRIVVLLVPDIVREEFARNKARIIEDSRRSLSSTMKRVKEVVDRFGADKAKPLVLEQLNEIAHRAATLGEAVNDSIARFEGLFAKGKKLKATNAIKVRAAERAIAKLAPFHRQRNGINDALLVELYADAITREGEENIRFAFVTHNTNDFSEPGADHHKPHPDIAAVFSPRSFYSINLGETLNSIAPELLEEFKFELEWTEEPRRLSEILENIDELKDKVWYNRHWNRRIAIEEGRIQIVERETFPVKDHATRPIQRDIWEGALKAAKRVERKYGIKNLGPWDDFEWGMINGKLSALRWVLGDEWDMLDT